MKRIILLTGMCVFLLVSLSYAAAIPKMINYQGYLADSTGTPLTGAYSMTFKIYDDSAAGNLEWAESQNGPDQNGVRVVNGLFNVTLGAVIPLDLPFDEAYWLEVIVADEIIPRIRLTSVGYAYRAVVADSAAVAVASGTIVFDSLYVTGNAFKTIGTEHWSYPSDARFKDVVGGIDGALELVDELKPVKYTWNELHNEKYGEEPGIRYGFTAQNVRDVIPEFVTEDAEGYLLLNTSGYEAVLTKAIQELKAQNDTLKEQNIARQSRVTELEEENQALRRTMQSIETRLSSLEQNKLLYQSAIERYRR